MKTTALTMALGAPLSLALIACAPEGGAGAEAEDTAETAEPEAMGGEEGEDGEDGEPVDERTTDETGNEEDRVGPEDRTTPEEEAEAR